MCLGVANPIITSTPGKGNPPPRGGRGAGLGPRLGDDGGGLEDGVGAGRLGAGGVRLDRGVRPVHRVRPQAEAQGGPGGEAGEVAELNPGGPPGKHLHVGAQHGRVGRGAEGPVGVKLHLKVHALRAGAREGGVAQGAGHVKGDVRLRTGAPLPGADLKAVVVVVALGHRVGGGAARQAVELAEGADGEGVGGGPRLNINGGAILQVVAHGVGVGRLRGVGRAGPGVGAGGGLKLGGRHVPARVGGGVLVLVQVPGVEPGAVPPSAHLARPEVHDDARGSPKGQVAEVPLQGLAFRVQGARRARVHEVQALAEEVAHLQAVAREGGGVLRGVGGLQGLVVGVVDGSLGPVQVSGGQGEADPVALEDGGATRRLGQGEEGPHHVDPLGRAHLGRVVAPGHGAVVKGVGVGVGAGGAVGGRPEGVVVAGLVQVFVAVGRHVPVLVVPHVARLVAGVDGDGHAHGAAGSDGGEGGGGGVVPGDRVEDGVVGAAGRGGDEAELGGEEVGDDHVVGRFGGTQVAHGDGVGVGGPARHPGPALHQGDVVGGVVGAAPADDRGAALFNGEGGAGPGLGEGEVLEGEGVLAGAVGDHHVQGGPHPDADGQVAGGDAGLGLEVDAGAVGVVDGGGAGGRADVAEVHLGDVPAHQLVADVAEAGDGEEIRGGLLLAHLGAEEVAVLGEVAEVKGVDDGAEVGAGALAAVADDVVRGLKGVVVPAVPEVEVGDVVEEDLELLGAGRPAGALLAGGDQELHGLAGVALADALEAELGDAVSVGHHEVQLGDVLGLAALVEERSVLLVGDGAHPHPGVLDGLAVLGHPHGDADGLLRLGGVEVHVLGLVFLPLHGQGLAPLVGDGNDLNLAHGTGGGVPLEAEVKHGGLARFHLGGPAPGEVARSARGHGVGAGGGGGGEEAAAAAKGEARVRADAGAGEGLAGVRPVDVDHQGARGGGWGGLRLELEGEGHHLAQLHARQLGVTQVAALVHADGVGACGGVGEVRPALGVRGGAVRPVGHRGPRDGRPVAVHHQDRHLALRRAGGGHGEEVEDHGGGLARLHLVGGLGGEVARLAGLDGVAPRLQVGQGLAAGEAIAVAVWTRHLDLGVRRGHVHREGPLGGRLGATPATPLLATAREEEGESAQQGHAECL